MIKSFSYYNDQFYDDQASRSYSSAVAYVDHLCKYYKALSVVDVGCGRGSWLKAFGEKGVNALTGLDGSWNSQEKMLSQKIYFQPIDLAFPSMPTETRYDLAVSLEVAEHLPKTSANQFVSFLVQLSDVVLFSAAFTNQGGDNHINEQPHSYWAQKFLNSNYIAYDLFRPFFWDDSSVDFCYRQNVFLYVNATSKLNNSLASQGVKPLINIGFMDCVHPCLYAQRSSLQAMVMRGLGKATPAPMRPFVKSILRLLH
jgi:SAM-dependent methyltransferase